MYPEGPVPEPPEVPDPDPEVVDDPPPPPPPQPISRRVKARADKRAILIPSFIQLSRLVGQCKKKKLGRSVITKSASGNVQYRKFARKQSRFDKTVSCGHGQILPPSLRWRFAKNRYPDLGPGTRHFWPKSN
jgi:hypothetical protein